MLSFIGSFWTLLNICCPREIKLGLRYGIGIFMPLTYSFTKTMSLALLTGRMHGLALCSFKHDTRDLLITTENSW